MSIKSCLSQAGWERIRNLYFLLIISLLLSVNVFASENLSDEEQALIAILDKYKALIPDMAQRMQMAGDNDTVRFGSDEARLIAESANFFNELLSQGKGTQAYQSLRGKLPNWKADYLGIERALMMGRALIVQRVLRETLIQFYNDNPEAIGTIYGEMDIGTWVKMQTKTLQFDKDIDLSSLATDDHLNMRLRDAFTQNLQKITRVANPDIMIKMDALITPHGRASSEVFIGEWGKTFAEMDLLARGKWKLIMLKLEDGRVISPDEARRLRQQGKTLKVMDIQTREMPGSQMFWWRAFLEGRDFDPPKVTMQTEPMLSLEMSRHLIADIERGNYTGVDKLLKMMKYVERSYLYNQKATSPYRSEWDPFNDNDQILGEFAVEITKAKQAKDAATEMAKVLERYKDKLNLEGLIKGDKSASDEAINDLLKRAKKSIIKNSEVALALRLRQIASIKDEGKRNQDIDRMLEQMHQELEVYKHRVGDYPEGRVKDIIWLSKKLREGDKWSPDVFKQTMDDLIKELSTEEYQIDKGVIEYLFSADDARQLRIYLRDTMKWTEERINKIIDDLRRKYPNLAKGYDRMRGDYENIGKDLPTFEKIHRKISDFHEEWSSTLEGSTFMKSLDFADNLITFIDAGLSEEHLGKAVYKVAGAYLKVKAVGALPSLQVAEGIMQAYQEGDSSPAIKSFAFYYFPTIGAFYGLGEKLQRLDVFVRDQELLSNLDDLRSLMIYDPKTGHITGIKTGKYSDVFEFQYSQNQEQRANNFVDFFMKSDTILSPDELPKFRFWMTLIPRDASRYGYGRDTVRKGDESLSSAGKTWIGEKLGLGSLDISGKKAKFQRLKKYFGNNEELLTAVLILENANEAPSFTDIAGPRLAKKRQDLLQNLEDRIERAMWKSLFYLLEASATPPEDLAKLITELETIEKDLSLSDTYLSDIRGYGKGLINTIKEEIKKQLSKDYYGKFVYDRYYKVYSQIKRIQQEIILLWTKKYGINWQEITKAPLKLILEGSINSAPRLTIDTDTDLKKAQESLYAHTARARAIDSDIYNAIGHVPKTTEELEHKRNLAQIGFEYEHLMDDCPDRTSDSCPPDLIDEIKKRARLYRDYLQSLKEKPCSYKYTDWSKCDEKTKKQTRRLTAKTPKDCVEKEKLVLEQTCIPDTKDEDRKRIEQENQKKAAEKLAEANGLAAKGIYEDAIAIAAEAQRLDPRNAETPQLIRKWREDNNKILERERTERERKEQERLELERVERERLERERIEKERQESEKQEQERKEEPKYEKKCKSVGTPASLRAEKGGQDQWAYIIVTIGGIGDAKKEAISGWKNNGTRFSGKSDGKNPIPIQIDVYAAGDVSYFDYNGGVGIKHEKSVLYENKILISKKGGMQSFSYTVTPKNDMSGHLYINVSVTGGNPDYFTNFVSGDIYIDPSYCFQSNQEKEKLTVALNKGKKTLNIGDTTNLSALVSGGIPPYKFVWSGAKGEGVFSTFNANKAGSYPISVTVNDSDGNTATASTTIVVEAINVKLEKLSPTGNTITIGGKGSFRATVMAGKDTARGDFVIRWEPYRERIAKFKDRETTGATGTNEIKFMSPGSQLIYVDVFQKIEGMLQTVGESEQIAIQVKNPAWEMAFDPAQPKVGQMVKATLKATGVPEEDIKAMNFEWQFPQNTKQTGAEQKDGVASFYLKDTRPANIQCVVRLDGENLGGVGKTITAQGYEVSISEPKYSGPPIQMWQCETQLGGAPKCGMVQLKSTHFVTHSDIFLTATVTPAAESPRYKWSIDPAGSCGSPGAGSEIKINCSNTGTYTVKVEVTNADGVKLGEAARSVSITITQQQIDNSKKAKEAYDKLQKAKELVNQGRLDEGIQMADEASRLDPKNTEAGSLVKKWRTEKERVLSSIKTMDASISKNKVEDAEKSLSEARKLHPKYQPVVDAEKRLQDAKKKAEEEKKKAEELKKQIADKIAKAKELMSQGKLDEAITLIDEALKLDPKHTEALALGTKWKAEKQTVMKHIGTVKQMLTGNKLSEAEKALSEAQKLHPKYQPVTDAEKLLKDAKDKADKEKQVKDKVAKAKELVSQGKLDEAISLIDEALKLEPKESEVAKLGTKWKAEKQTVMKHVDSIKKLIPLKRIVDAEKELLSAKKLHPKYGQVLEAEKMLNDAKKSIADQTKGENTARYIATARDQIQKNKLDEAEKTLRTVLQNDPTNAEAKGMMEQIRETREKEAQVGQLLNEGYTLEKLGNLRGAIQKYQKALDTVHDPKIQKRIEVLQDQIMQKEQKEIKEQQAQQLVNEGYDLEKQGNLSGAIQRYQQAVATVPNPDLQKRITQLKNQLKQEEQKQRKETQAQQLVNEGYSLEKQGNLKGAIQKYQQAIATIPNPELQERISALQNQMVQEEQRGKNEKQAQQLVNEGYNLEKQGNLKGAIQKYEQALAILPNHELQDRISALQNQIKSQQDQRQRIEYAKRLRAEGEALQKNKRLQEAIGKYRESLGYMPDPALEQHIAKLEAALRQPTRPGSTSTPTATPRVDSSAKINLSGRWIVNCPGLAVEDVIVTINHKGSNFSATEKFTKGAEGMPDTTWQGTIVDNKFSGYAHCYGCPKPDKISGIILSQNEFSLTHESMSSYRCYGKRQ